VNDLLIRTEQISKAYVSGEKHLQILDGIDFQVKPGEFNASGDYNQVCHF
jgi:ABC-type lipoprotein export system ATPase subunit